MRRQTGWQAVSERVRSERIRQHLTQQRVAELAGVSLTTVQKLESGARGSYHASTAGKVWEALGLDLAEMMRLIDRDAPETETLDVVEAVRRDRLLSKRDKQMLMAMYEQFLRLRDDNETSE